MAKERAAEETLVGVNVHVEVKIWLNLVVQKPCEDSKIVKSWSVMYDFGTSLVWVNVVLNVFFLPPGPTKTLFVKGLSEDTTDQSLKDAFDGAVAARIVTDKETGSSKGWVCPVIFWSCWFFSWAPLCLTVTVNGFAREVEQTDTYTGTYLSGLCPCLMWNI